MVDVVEVSTPEAHFDDESFTSAAQRLIKLKNTATECALQDHYDAARTAFGTLLHTLQDFYSHSDWIEIGYETPNTNLAISESLGPIAPPDMQTCFSCTTISECQVNINAAVVEQKLLTSGYFSLNPFSAKEKLRCSHGGTFDFTAKGRQGINKDNNVASHGHLHVKAAKVAENSTVFVLKSLWDTIGDARFRNFLGFSGSSFAISIDTTGSMVNEIRALRKITSELFTSVQRPFNFVLSPFNDPKVGPVVISRSLDQFKDAVNELTAAGGGDEPEMFYSGLLNAVAFCEPYSTVFTLTDASPKDRKLSNMIKAIVMKKNLRIVPIVSSYFFGRSSKIAPLLDTIVREYHKLAAFAGGSLFLFNKKNLTSLPDVLREQQKSFETLLVSKIENSSPDGDIFSFYVDESIGEIHFRINSIGPLEFNVSNASSDILWMYNDVFSKVFSLQKPLVGMWRLWVKSNSSYSVVVTGKSEISFRSSLHEENGNPVHVGLVRLQSLPVRGQNASVFTEIENFNANSDNWKFYVDFVREDLSLIQSHQAEIKNNASLLTSTRVPFEDFRLRIRAENDKKRLVFERYQAELISVTSLKVSFMGLSESGLVSIERRNKTISFRYTIENLGDMREEFRVEIKDSLRMIDFSKVVVLNAREKLSENTLVDLHAVNKWLFGVDIVTMSVQSIDSDTISQYAAINLYFI